MMMAHHSSPDPGALAQATLDVLRAALTEYIDRPGDGEALRAALHSVAHEAREKAILPEKLLIALKEVWYELPSVRAMQQTDQQIRLLQRVVTMCIKEYYGEPPA